MLYEKVPSKERAAMLQLRQFLPKYMDTVVMTCYDLNEKLEIWRIKLMEIRRAIEHELLELWGYESIHAASSNAKFFCGNMKRGNAEFWTLDYDGELVGELYVFYDLEDKDFADGKRTAYLCAFRVRADLRGQGLGTKLICHVMEHIKDLGYQRISIGVDTTDMANIRLYERLGFTIRVKACTEDPCDRDENMQPRSCPRFWLLYKEV